jgi:DNA-binding NarL/FixJ family response regulator
MIDVMIVEDDQGIREGLTRLIAAEPDLACTRRHGSAERALADALAAPDVILLDIHLPGMLGSTAVPKFVARYPRAAIVMLTIHDGEERVFEAICNGARGYLLKKTPPARLVAAIREADEGGAPMSPSIARLVVSAFQRVRPLPSEHAALTAQERNLLALLADGYSYLNAAGQLGISINTVRNHVRSIYDKLHVHTKSEAVAKALKGGLLR